MHFPLYTGGKFISNCLSLSKYAQPMTTKGIDHITSIPEDYEFRLELILQTLPDRKNVHNWSAYEFSDTRFHGSNSDIKIHNKLDHFRTVHCFTELENWLQLHNNNVIITLTNWEKFRKLAHGLKDTNNQRPIGNEPETHEYYQTIMGADWPDWKQFNSLGYNTTKLHRLDSEIVKEIQSYYPIIHKHHYCFNVDDTIFNKSAFMDAMHKLYNNLGYDDFNEKPVEIYWKKYISLHTGETNGKTV